MLWERSSKWSRQTKFSKRQLWTNWRSSAAIWSLRGASKSTFQWKSLKRALFKGWMSSQTPKRVKAKASKTGPHRTFSLPRSSIVRWSWCSLTTISKSNQQPPGSKSVKKTSKDRYNLLSRLKRIQTLLQAGCQSFLIKLSKRSCFRTRSKLHSSLRVLLMSSRTLRKPKLVK